MELGMVNPEWGYWWRTWSRLAPDHWLFRTMNQLAWSTEVVAAGLMLLPPTRFLGALLIILSFAFIATQIRLGLLTEMVMLCGVLYFQPGTAGDAWLAWMPAAAASTAPPLAIPWFVTMALAGALWGYLILLPLAHGGLFYNFYAKKSFRRPLQRVLEAYTNFFGIIIWRVFSVDVVNFFILVHRERRDGGDRTLISDYGWGGSLRYNDVCESIALTSVFTTLKYYPSNSALFRERLLRYARTVPCPADCVLVFEYVSVRKRPTHFEHVPVAEYVVDLPANLVDERPLTRTFSVRAAHAVSPIHEGQRPGSYVPLRT
jgi:hypothetical protein